MRGGRGREGLALLLLFFILSCNRASPLVPVTAPSAIAGNAQMRRGGTAAWVRVWPETVLYAGDSLYAVDSTEITFLDGTSLRLSPGVHIFITRFDPDENTLAFETDMANYEARAASARIQVAEAGARVRTESGQVLVTVGNQTQIVSQGQTRDVGDGIPMSAIVDAVPLRAATATRPPTTALTPEFIVSAPLLNAGPSPTVTLNPPTAIPAVPIATATLRPALSIRVNCGGGNYSDSRGLRWSADKQYVAGQWGYTGGKVYTSGNDIANTQDDLLYQSERWGDFFYLFDIPNDRYRVTLYFAELYRDNPEVRQFGVRIEGHWVLSNLDLVAVAGRDVAYNRSFEVDLADGQLGIEFERQLDNPKVNAIQIVAIR